MPGKRNRPDFLTNRSSNVRSLEEKTWGFTQGQKNEIAATRELYKNSFEIFCKNELNIIDRESPSGAGVKNFVWNDAQRKLERTISLIKLYNLRRSKALHEKDPNVVVSEYPVQIVVLKPRKVGISTYLQARALWRCEFESHIEAMIMAHEAAAAKNIAGISKRYISLWRTLPTDYRKTLIKVNDNRIEWGTDPVTGEAWGSKMHVTTAGLTQRGTSRGFTYHFVHISEEAHFKSESEVAAALAATVPYKETYEESTANGLGGMFYDNFNNAADIESVMQGNIPHNWNGKFRFFFPWYADSAYSLPITDTERSHINRTLSERELFLKEHFNCTDEQLYWRRMKIGTECTAQSEMEPEDYFNQEYPTEPNDAFVTSGNNVFSTKPLLDMHAAAKKIAPHWQGHLSTVDGDDLCIKMPTTHEPMCIQYFPPVEGGQYIIGVDTCEGLKHGDNSVLTVWLRKSHEFMEEVCRVIGKAQSDDLARMAVYWARIYNDAFIIAESNGNATNLYINRLGYTNMYMRENPEVIGGAGVGEKFILGFNTNLRTKPLLVSAGQDAIRHKRVTLRNRTAIRQWQIYRNVDGSYKAPEGDKDDCVMADLLAIWAHFTNQAPLVRRFHETHKEENAELKNLSAESKLLWEKVAKLKKEAKRVADRKRVIQSSDIFKKWY